MAEGRGTPVSAGCVRHPHYIRSCKNIDHGARDLASCRQGRCERTLIGRCKVEFT